MRRFVIGLLCAVAGYAVGALVGYGLIEWLSTNSHDRSVEAAMTGAFVFGPLGAVIAFVAGFMAARRRSALPAGEEA
jgi:hypothetical protein